jgi:hypothetical protein
MSKKLEYKQITIASFYKIQDAIASGSKDAESEIISELTGKPLDELRKMKRTEWNILWSNCQALIEEAAAEGAPVQNQIEFKGVKYALPTIENMTVGEFADLEILFAEQYVNRKLEQVAGILYRPVIKTNSKGPITAEYDAGEAADRADLFKDLPIAAIRSANTFFFSYAESLLKNTLVSLMEMEETKMLPQSDQEVLSQLLRQGFGGTSSTSSLEKILLNLQSQLLSSYVLPSTGLAGKPTKLKSIISKFKTKIQKLKNKIK